MITAYTFKRISLIAVVAAVGIAGVAGYRYYLENEEALPVLGQVQPQTSQTQQLTVPTAAVTFSHTETFYEDTIAVEMTAAEGSKIYYTLDGSPPTESSQEYTEPLVIRSGSKVSATTIKAVAVSEEETSAVITKSYITGTTVFERFDEGTYVFVLSADPYDLYDYEDGIAVEGKIRDEWLKNEYDGHSAVIPTDPANWNQEGMAGERPMYFEVYDSAGNKLIEQQAGARVAGAYSRSWPQKSWKLIARRMYTPDAGMFDFAFFSDATDADGVLLTEYDRIVLRNGANDREHGGVREELSAALAKQSGFLDVQSAVPAAVFLNGEYYGFAWLHQNYCKGYLESRYGGNKDNFQIVGKAEGSIDEGENDKSAADAFNEMLEFAKDGLTDDERFERFCEMVDIDNYIHYAAIQLFIDNRDWPQNNYKAWRYVAGEDEEVSGKYLDGKWRFLLYDVEFAWGIYSNGYSNRTLAKIIKGGHPGGKSELLGAVLEREDMQEKLANTICDLIGDSFSTENTLTVLQQLLEESDPEQMYALNAGVTSTWADEGSFESSRREIKAFALNRADVVFGDMAKVFKAEKSYYKITVEGEEGLEVRLNTIVSKNGETVSADYFTKYSVPLTASGYSGYEFDSWEINGEKYTEQSISLTHEMVDENGEIKVKAYARKTAADAPFYISEVYTSGDADWIKLYNPNDVAMVTKNLYMSDDEMVLNKWKIPTATIQPGESATIVCKNNIDSSSLLKMQTNFSLKAGETLTLSDGSGNILAKVVITDCENNCSQKRQTDGTYKTAIATDP